MTSRRTFIKCFAGLGAWTVLSWNIMLPKAAVSKSISVSEQLWKKNKEETLSFVVVSDIHIGRRNARRNFSALLMDNYYSKPDAMVVVGDLGDGLSRDYRLLNKELAEHKIMINYPIHWTIGNHEFYRAFYKNGVWSPRTFPNKETDAIAIDRFLTLANRNMVYGDTWLNDYHFIFLGSEKFRISDMNYTDKANLSDAQLDWLQALLNRDKQLHKPIFVFLHQPIPYTTLEEFQRGYVIQWQKLNDILSQYPGVILFNGHTHRAIDYKNMVSEANYTIVNSSSLACPIDRNRKVILDFAPGFVVNVYEDRVVIKGRDFLKQDWISAAEITIPANFY